MKRIHIVSISPRTGTTLLAEAMIACFNIDHYTEHEDKLFRRVNGGGNNYLTKNPDDILIVGPSLIVDPNLYVIYMIRDPRDIICSKHGREPNKYWTSLRFWKIYKKYGERLKFHKRFIQIKYEDLVNNPDTVQEKLMNRIPFLEKKKKFSEYHLYAKPSESSQQALKGLRPILPNNIGIWKQHKERVLAQIKIHGSISKDLIKFGYEKDNAWEKELNGTVPDNGEAYWPEFMSKDERKRLKRYKYREAIRRMIENCGINPKELKKKFKLTT